MKVYAVTVFACNSANPTVLAQATDISQFGLFRQGTIKDLVLFISRELIARTKPGEWHTIIHQQPQNRELDEDDMAFVVFSTVKTIEQNNFGCVVITDASYPTKVAQNFLIKGIEEVIKAHGNNVIQKAGGKDAYLTVPALKVCLAKYQKPEEVNKVLKIEADIQETSQVMMKTFDQMLARGERLEDLLEKSNDLKYTSKVFMKKTQKMNKCCTIL